MPKELVNAITSKLKYRNTSVDVGKRNGKHEQSKMYENKTQSYICLHFSQQKNYLHNRYWRNTLIGSYLNVARTRYHHDRAIITVGRVIRVKILYYPTQDWHQTRNQFIAASQLENFTTAYNYMKHNYAWYNKLLIHHALRHWRRISASKHCNKF